MAMIIGFILAYPINWWLVVNNMKHGMLTVRPEADAPAGHTGSAEHGNSGDNASHETSDAQEAGGHDEHGEGERPGMGTIIVVTILTFLALMAGLKLAGGFFG